MRKRTPRTRSLLVGAWAAAVALSLAALVPAPAGADLPTDLAAARARLTQLTNRITREEATVRSLQGELRSLAVAAGRERTGLANVRGDLATTRSRLVRTKAQIATLQDQIRTRVRVVYKRGPLEFFAVVLGSQDIGQFVNRITYASRLARRDTDLVLEMRVARAKLRSIQARQRRLERVRATTLQTLSSRQTALNETFARQQGLMADLAQARIEALRLLEQLRDRLAATELANFRRVAGRGMTISYGQWAREFLGSLGAEASRSNQVAVIAWEAAEGTQATWNPLATTFYMPNSTVYNSHGVRNYKSKEDGITASVGTLHRPGHGYEAIVSSLRASADAMDSAEAINRSDWCRGCAGGSYVIGFVPAVERYYDRYGGR